MPNPNPALTVLMPAFNAGAYIREAIESVLSQSFEDFEFLIIDDGSKDDSLRIIQSFQDPRIRVISRANKGLIASLNEGIGLARSGLIARHDADDICLPQRLEKQYSFLQQHPKYLLVGSDAEYVDQDGNYLCKLEAPVGYRFEEIWKRRFEKNPFIHPAVMFRKDAALAAGAYPKNALQFEDWLLWLRMMAHGPGCNLPEVLLQVRINPESVTIDERWRPEAFHEIRRRSLEQEEVQDADAAQLAGLIQAQGGQAFKQASYHALVAKKYLWNNHNATMARKHLREALKAYPRNSEPYLLYMLSFLPSGLIRVVYKTAKRK
ncbi:MAG: glycosyltransferase [Bacteroidetes bacterium]|nr:glycosyltransferase [Bacteroidota bacterium]